ncbi:MAG TPA: cation diffusion facilitator family transporter [Flavitalea sp.]|nr:cation diffusion facilitator family transporter [Flavitalea sp.]
MDPRKENLLIQKIVVAVAVLLFIIKIFAYFITKSVSVLTDALESIANVGAGFIGLYSLHIAAQPKDQNHPYGHGKAEFLSAGVEGTLIIIAGAAIIYKSINSILYPVPLRQLDKGMILIGITAVINYLVGFISVYRGKKNNSLALIASGKHLQSDTYSTLGIMAGLILIYFTKLLWLDSAIALFFAVVIIVTGYRIIRSSIAGIMDEADLGLLEKMVDMLNKNRQENWVDLHNLRVIKYGGQLHVDCHLTVPWYLNVHEAHSEIDKLAALIKKEFGNTIELFVHSDGCLYFQCNICSKHDCHVRQKPFEHQVPWNTKNLLKDAKHSAET